MTDVNQPHFEADKTQGGFLLYGTVFVVSLCMMAVELVAARIVAMHLGSSLYSWTSVIGVVLAGLAIGNYAGGQMADRLDPRRCVAVVLMCGASLCLLAPPLNAWALDREFLWMMSWPVRVASHMALVFLWPATAMGMISPLVAKLALERAKQTGQTVGSLYAWGTVGSIVGTFLAGYWLIRVLGTIGTLCAAAMAMGLLSLAFARRPLLPVALTIGAALCMWIALAGSPLAVAMGEAIAYRMPYSDDLLFEEESQYSWIRVERAAAQHPSPGEPPDAKAAVVMRLDQLVHSEYLPADPYRLQYAYERIYAAVTHRFAPKDRPFATFNIGGGGFVFPLYLHHEFPEGYIEAAEIDPRVTEAAIVAMGLPRDNALHIHNMDAGNRIAELIRERQRGEGGRQYDFIYGDSINDFTVPFHLVTREFNEKLHSLMAPGGVYMLNMVDSFRTGRFLGAVLNTLSQTWPHVQVVTDDPLDEAVDERLTFVVIASDRPLDLAELGRSYPQQPDSRFFVMTPVQMDAVQERVAGLILTDDYAPVENLLAPMVERSLSRETAERLARRGTAQALAGNVERAIAEYRRALKRDARSAVVIDHACRAGDRLAASGDWAAAAELLEMVVRANPAVGRAHLLLAICRLRMGDAQGAMASFEAAARIDPLDGGVRLNWGAALIGLGRYEESIPHLEAAVALDPSLRAPAYTSLADAMRALNRPDQAARYEELARQAGNKDATPSEPRP